MMGFSGMLTGTLWAMAIAAGDLDRVANRYRYRGEAGGQDRITTAGDPSWQTHSIEATVNPIADSGGSLGVILHHQDNDNYYLFLCGFPTRALRIYKKAGGSYTLLASTPFQMQIGRSYRLRGTADTKGNLRLFLNGELKTTARDMAFNSGKIGLRVWQNVTDFDDIVAHDADGDVLLYDNFEDGDDAGWSGGDEWSVVPVGGAGRMPAPEFDTDFEGGNIQVDGIDTLNWTIFTRPELKGTSPYRAWYYFKLSNTSSERPTHIVVSNVRWGGVPYYSYDNLTWQRFSGVSGNTYTQTFTADPVWIAASIPYLTADLYSLIDDIAGLCVRTSELTTSEEGRPVQRITITDFAVSRPKRAVWFVARQHAWEASGSWVADGVARWAASNDPLAERLRRASVLNIVPIMDIDNVVLGGSGKDQSPIDFNRDWRETPYWNAVNAAIAAIDELAALEPYSVFIDSHSPGPVAEPFIYVQPQSMAPAAYWSAFQRFRAILVSEASGGPLPYTGVYRELGPDYHPLWRQISMWHQFTEHPQLSLSITFETPPASAEGYRAFSEGIGRSLFRFLPHFETAEP